MGLIFHTATGAGGPPIVFVHGFACSHNDWDAQLAHFAVEHHCIAVDLRGHGQSPGDAADCSIERYGADVAETLRALDLPRAVLIGHSLGCRVVIEAALQAPAFVAGLVLVDGSQFAVSMEPVLRGRFAAPGGFESTVSTLFVEMFTAKSDPAVVAATVARARRLAPAIGQKMLLDMLRYDAYRLEASWRCVSVPVLALQATWSNERRERSTMKIGQSSPYLEKLRTCIPAAEIEIIENTGHFPQIDEPAQVNAAIARFIGSL